MNRSSSHKTITCEVNAQHLMQVYHLFTSTVRVCPLLTAPENGGVAVTGDSIGSVAVYVCDEGFSLIGDSPRICGANGEWSGSEPVCVLISKCMSCIIYSKVIDNCD